VKVVQNEDEQAAGCRGVIRRHRVVFGKRRDIRVRFRTAWWLRKLDEAERCDVSRLSALIKLEVLNVEVGDETAILVRHDDIHQ